MCCICIEATDDRIIACCCSYVAHHSFSSSSRSEWSLLDETRTNRNTSSIDAEVSWIWSLRVRYYVWRWVVYDSACKDWPYFVLERYKLSRSKRHTICLWIHQKQYVYVDCISGPFLVCCRTDTYHEHLSIRIWRASYLRHFLNDWRASLM